MDKFDLKKFLTEGKLLKETREEQYIDPYDNPDFYDEEGNMKDEAYREEFGFSFKERQDWEKILDQVKKQNNFDAFDPKSLRNYDKIEDEANQIYTQKYGSSFLQENKSLKENEDWDFEESILKIVNELKEYNSVLSPGNYIKEKLGKAIEELEGVLDEDEIELSSVSKPIKDEPKPETLDLDESKSLNELDSLSNVFDTITGEYEDEDENSPTYGEVVFEEYKYHQVKDFIEEMYEKSRNVDDFIGKVTMGITNTTSELSPEDQDKLYKWYDKKNWNDSRIRNNTTNRTYRPVNEERGEGGMVNGVNGKMHFFSEEDPDLGDIPNMRRYLGGDSGPYIQAHYGYVDYTIVKENSEYQLMKGHYNYGASADKNIYMIFDKNSKMLIDWEEWGYEELEKIYF